MLYLRIDDDHIIRLDRIKLTAQIKLTFSAQTVEQLGAGMGVSGAVPIAAKFALADVQQPEGFPWSGSMADIKSLGTHKWLLLRQNAKTIKRIARY